MKLNEAMNLVFPVGDRMAYHTPISREVFEANYRILAATKAAFSDKGAYYQFDAGPRVAALTLMDAARADSEERGKFVLDANGKPVLENGSPVPSDEDAKALLAEIKRLTLVLCPSPQGFDMLPVDAALQAGHIDSEDWGEAQSNLVFFTCLWSMSSKATRPRMAEMAASRMMGSITSQSPTEVAASLQASMQAKPSKAAASSVPS